MLISVQRQTGRQDERLTNPEKVPSVGLRAWNAFFDVNRSRQSNGYGPSAISNQELLAWCSLMDEKLTPWEVNVFKMMDSTFLDEYHIKQQEGA